MMGATLPLLTDFFKCSPRYTTTWKVGILYATNTFGAAIGAIISGFFLIELLGVQMTMLLAAALNFVVALTGFRFSSSPLIQETSTKKDTKRLVEFNGKLALFVLAAGGGIALASEVLWTRLLEIIVGHIFAKGWSVDYKKSLALPLSMVSLSVIIYGCYLVNQTSQFVSTINTPDSPVEVVYHKPGFQGITSILKRKDEKYARLLLVDGRGMTVKVTETKMIAHLPMLLHPNPQKTLVICFGMGTTSRSAITYGGKVMVVELVREVLDGFNYFYGDADRVRKYVKGKMIVNDGRNFLKLTHEKYDVITIDPPPPIDGAGVNNLYSQDFAELAKSKLAPGGIMADWIPYPGTSSGVDDWGTFSMLVYSFARVFPYVYTIKGWNSVGLHVIGSEQPLNINIDEIRKKMKNPLILKDITEWNPVTANYFKKLKLLKDPKILPPPVTDDRPRLEFSLLRTWDLPKKYPFSLVWAKALTNKNER